MSRTLLLEIGVEELPAGYVPPALDQLANAAPRELAALRLSHGEVRVLGTPRRLVLMVESVADRQPDHEEEALGPAARVAFDSEGKPTKALLGFCRGKGVNPEEVRRVDTPKGEYVAVTVHDAGRNAVDVLPGMLAALATRLAFPKSMRWLADDTRFARPVRWLLALFGDEVLSVEAFGLQGGRRSFGHRFLAPAAVKVANADAYLETLDTSGVIVDPVARMERLREQIDALAAAGGGRVVADDELVAINTFLVEWPTAFSGAFDERYLDLPREVVVTALREHQRFFAVENGEGRLLPSFIAVRNGDDRGLDGVRKGNEDVLIARLEDARFYWETDLKQPPAGRLDDLKSVVWLEGLGSLRDKAGRLESLAAWLGERLAPSSVPAARRAALLCKTDLLSEMIGSGKEYTSLEGVMGGHYARHAGEPAEVAEAIAQHYRPRGRSDALPVSDAAVVLSIADKLDHVAGSFVAGKVPSGSEDPYGVRRAANGVLRILLEGNRHLDLRAATTETTRPFFTADPQLPHGDIMRALGEFWRGRAEAALDERGVPYDARDAALDARVTAGERGGPQPGWIDPVDGLERAQVLNAFRADPHFEPLVILFKRVANILKATKEEVPDAVDRKLLEEDAERKLLSALEKAQKNTRALWAARDYRAILPALLEMESAIHGFFEHVLVNAENMAWRQNRLRLLTDVRALFLRGWDLSKVVVEGERSQAAAVVAAAEEQ